MFNSWSVGQPSLMDTVIYLTNCGPLYMRYDIISRNSLWWKLGTFCTSVLDCTLPDLTLSGEEDDSPALFQGSPGKNVGGRGNPGYGGPASPQSTSPKSTCQWKDCSLHLSLQTKIENLRQLLFTRQILSPGSWSSKFDNATGKSGLNTFLYIQALNGKVRLSWFLHS